MHDFLIVGAGIVGLASGMALLEENPGANVIILEKESHPGLHQTGHNSGVIHSGIYYKPGSYKAKFAKAGSESMRDFCLNHNIPHEICGKVIVASNNKELQQLEALYYRGVKNGLSPVRLTKEELLEREPHVNGLEAIYLPTTGIVDYQQVAGKMAEIFRSKGGQIVYDAEVKAISETGNAVSIDTDQHTYHANLLLNCSGLYSDRIAKMAGYLTDMRIFPFRGEYFKLKQERSYLVNHLIYPVPDPDFPFLGVHATRMIDGGIEVGPNAVPGLKREAYKKTSFAWKDFYEIISYPGIWKLGSSYAKEGAGEMVRSLSKKRFVENLRRLLPDISEDDLIAAPAGVRAQALQHDGTLIDDFFIVNGKRSIHVCNAPSPAATAALEIGKEISGRILERAI